MIEDADNGDLFKDLNPIIIGGVPCQIMAPRLKAPTHFDPITVTRGGFRVTWEYIGEGLSGDFNPEDPIDYPHLRFSCDRNEGSTEDGARWVETQDGSYCTRLPTDTPVEYLLRAADLILEALEHPSHKRRLEELSWLCRADFRVSTPAATVRVIQNTDEEDSGLFWCNDVGWVGIESATVFGEHEDVNLPVGGKWVTLRALTNPAAPIGLMAAGAYSARYADEDHPKYSRADWRAEVQNGDTQLGYYEWLLHKEVSDAHDPTE